MAPVLKRMTGGTCEMILGFKMATTQIILKDFRKLNRKAKNKKKLLKRNGLKKARIVGLGPYKEPKWTGLISIHDHLVWS
jgi:hypothetical protein